MKIKSLLLATLVMVAFTLHAQPKEGKKGKQKVSKEYKAEMKAFYQNEMYPILKEKHSEFDAALSADDLKALQNLRAENNAIQEQMKALKKTMRAERKNSDDKEAIKAKYDKKIKVLRQSQRTSMRKLRPILEGNQELIKSSMASLKDLRGEWREQKQAIATKHDVEIDGNGNKAKRKNKRKNKVERTEEGTEDVPNKERAERKKGKKGKGKRAEGKRGGKEMRAAAKFLLWDGSLKSIAEVDEKPAKTREGRQN